MIPRQVADLLQTGVSVIIGTRNAALMPECTRAWGIRVTADGKATVFLAETISQRTLENLRENGLIAISCTRPTDHVACQLKGRVRSIRPASAADRDAARQWHREFIGEIIAIGVPAELCEAWIAEPTVSVEVDVTDVFEQTPGPGAGEKLR